MIKIIEKKMWQIFVLKICFPLETYHVQPIIPYWSPKWNITKNICIGCIRRSRINNHSLPLDPHNTWNLYLPKFITFKIPSNFHHPPNHRLLHLLLAYSFLKDKNITKNNSSFRINIDYTLWHSSFQCHQKHFKTNKSQKHWKT
jgi:hypothetical protein